MDLPKLDTNTIIIIAVFVVVVYFISKFFSQKKGAKIINRAEIEKKRRIEELKYNNNTILIRGADNNIYPVKIDYICIGEKVLGRVKNIANRVDKNNNIFYEIVFSPLLFWKISGWKKELIRVSNKELEQIHSLNQNFIEIKEGVCIDKHLNYYYTIPSEKETINWINENLYKHDKEANTSFYEVESQKRATFDIDTAKELDLKEKEIQIELMKKKGFVERL